MNHDPHGYYQRLELDWTAPPAAIHVAYRRKARLLHPDIPVTGSAAAFMAVKEAYDVLSDPLRRAAYDQTTGGFDRLRSTVAPVVPESGEEIYAAPPPPPSTPKTRGPRLADMPLAVWACLGIILCVAAGMAVWHLNAPPKADTIVVVPATAPTVAPQVPPASLHPIRLVGIPNVYVIPSDSPALVMRYDQPRNAFVPIGQLPAFSAVQAVRVLPDHGLVEIRLNATTTGFIDAARLQPGNVTAAQQAYCTYISGPPPANGEVLERKGSGSGQMTIQNQSGQPLVVKLRNRNGNAAVTVYLAPGGDTVVGGLPDGPFRPDYAIGELWSRGCKSFVAGMRAQRSPTFSDSSAPGGVAIPPEQVNQGPPVDISDQDFEHD